MTRAALGLLVATGCSDDDATLTAAPPSEGGPVYAVSSNLFGADFSSTTSLLWLVNDLGSGSLDAASGIELPGGATIWGLPASGDLYVVSAEELTITKYAAMDGSIIEQGRLGLGGVGISFLLGEAMAFADRSRGYLFDFNSGRAFALDLDAMEITHVIDLSPALIGSAELTSIGDGGFRRRDGRLVAPLFGTTTSYERVASESKIVIFDPASEALEVIEAPCGGLGYSVATPDGDTYFATDPYVASVHLITPADAPAPCMVRLPRGAQSVDPTTVALNDLMGAVAGGIVPGSEDAAYVRVLEGSSYVPSPDASYLEPFSLPAWTTWRIDLKGSEAPAPVDRASLAGGIKVFEVDGEAYENDSTANFASTTLVRTTGGPSPMPGLVMPGVTWGIVRLH